MGAYLKTHESWSYYLRGMATANRCVFHPERLKDLANIIEPDGPELAGILAFNRGTEDLLSSLHIVYYDPAAYLGHTPKFQRNCRMWHGVNHRYVTWNDNAELVDYLSHDEQKTFLKTLQMQGFDLKTGQQMLPIITWAERRENLLKLEEEKPVIQHVLCKAGVTISAVTEECLKDRLFLFFDKSVRGLELTKGERVKLASLLLGDIEQTEKSLTVLVRHGAA